MACRSARCGSVSPAGQTRSSSMPCSAAPRNGHFPIEHKRGRPKVGDEDRVQLCAQALCLEEMLGVSVPAGALFYGQSRRRAEVVFDDALRRRTEMVAAEVRALFDAGATPAPPSVAPCKSCSLVSACRPTAFRARRRSVASWIAGRLAEKDIPGDPL
jgi:CRISPR-associated exonuclease Cas4